MNIATMMMLNSVNAMNMTNNHTPVDFSNPVEVIALIIIGLCLLATLGCLVYVMVEGPVSRWMWNRRYRNNMKKYREKV